MSLVFNEAALNFLLESPDGPVGRELERISINVTQLVRDNATKILKGNASVPGRIQFEISNNDDGLQSVIGITSGGSNRWAEYLAAKERREAVIFAPALDVGLHQ